MKKSKNTISDWLDQYGDPEIDKQVEKELEEITIKHQREVTPKEKAKELVEMFIFFASNEGTTEDGFIYSDEMQMFNAKQCALIAVDEILNVGFVDTNDLYGYWQEVKQEIENL